MAACRGLTARRAALGAGEVAVRSGRGRGGPAGPLGSASACGARACACPAEGQTHQTRGLARDMGESPFCPRRPGLQSPQEWGERGVAIRSALPLRGEGPRALGMSCAGTQSLGVGSTLVRGLPPWSPVLYPCSQSGSRLDATGPPWSPQHPLTPCSPEHPVGQVTHPQVALCLPPSQLLK